MRGPVCFNPPASKTLLPETLKPAEWVRAGVSPAEIGERTRKAYASHELSMPALGAMAYMLSHDQLLADANPHQVPHLMFFYDRTQPAAVWGVSELNGTIINGSKGDDQNPVLTLLIPVRRRSDGALAVPEKGN